MERRLRHFITVALVIFVLINILTIVVILNSYFANMGNVTKFVTSDAQPNGVPATAVPPSGVAETDVPAVTLHTLIPDDGEIIIVHLQPDNADCTFKVAKIIQDGGLALDTELTNPLDLDDQVKGYLAIDKSSSSIAQLTEGLTKIKRFAKECLDIPKTASATVGKGNGVDVIETKGEGMKILFDSDEEDEEWLEYDSQGGPQLAQSVPLIGAPLVSNPPLSGGLGYDGTGVTVCLIDTGVETGNELVTQFNTALPLIVNGYNPKPPKGYKKEYNPDDSSAQYKKAFIIDDGSLNHHGTKMAGIIASNAVLSTNGKAPGVAPKVNLMVAKLPNESDVPGSFKASKKSFLKAVRFCLGKNRDNRKADVVYTGFAFADVKDKPTETLDLFTEKWQVGLAEKPKNSKVDSSNIISSVRKEWDSLGKKAKPKKTDPYLVPLVVPVGNLVGNGSNGLPNSLPFLDFAIAVGSASDAVLTNQPSSSDFGGYMTCADNSLQPNQALCNTACHTNSAGTSFVDVVGPSVSIFSTTFVPSFPSQDDLSNFGTVDSGTSVGAAHVAGVLALMKDANPNLTVAQLETKLKESATKSVNGVNLWTQFGDSQSCYGSGAVNALKAVQSALNG
jgi:subtilisin family serine protease